MKFLGNLTLLEGEKYRVGLIHNLDERSCLVIAAGKLLGSVRSIDCGNGMVTRPQVEIRYGTGGLARAVQSQR